MDREIQRGRYNGCCWVSEELGIPVPSHLFNTHTASENTMTSLFLSLSFGLSLALMLSRPLFVSRYNSLTRSLSCSLFLPLPYTQSVCGWLFVAPTQHGNLSLCALLTSHITNVHGQHFALNPNRPETLSHTHTHTNRHRVCKRQSHMAQ